MDKKKYKYENSTVLMVIAILAMFILFPPLARVFYPDESMDEVEETREFLYCSKESESEGFRVASSVYYLNNVPQKNTINFFDTKNYEVDEQQIVPPVEDGLSEIIVLDREVEFREMTVYAELEFFRHLQGVNFVDNRTSYSVEVNGDSLIVNEGNEELKKYLTDKVSQEAFYIEMGYSCYSEEA